MSATDTAYGAINSGQMVAKVTVVRQRLVM